MIAPRNRQPKGTCVGGQFAANKNPESTLDLAAQADSGDEIEFFAPWTINAGNIDEAVENAASLVERCVAGDGENSDFAQVAEILAYAKVVAEQDSVMCEYAEWLDELTTRADYLNDRGKDLSEDELRAHGSGLAADLRNAAGELKPGDREWTSAERTIDGIVYHVEREDNENDTVSYNLTDPLYKGGWKFEYDRLTRRATAQGKHPPLILDKNDMQAWHDRGEADIRDVVGALEPTAMLIKINGETYYVDGRQGWALSESVKSGLNTGQMMLTGGEKVKEIDEYVRRQRRLDAEQIRNHPELEGAVAETERYLTGIELAVEMGRDAAEANTVGAAKSRGLA